MPPSPLPEITLDPANWSEFSALAQQALGDALGFLEGVRERPVWRPVPEEIAREIAEPLPRSGRPLAEVYDQFRRCILPYPTGNIHPRFWGWVMGSGSALSVVSELLAATMNAHVAGYDQSAALVEERVLGWLKELMGFPAEASGVLVSGGTMANLIGLAVARHERAGFDPRAEGLSGKPPLMVYASTETHHWVEKACELLGLGRVGLTRIPCDSEHRVLLPELRQAIHRDRARGLRPICLVGSAGTVNIGATDDLRALAALSREENLWFHVDGAFGALARLSPALAPLVAGIEEADSLAFDLHKWGFLPYGVGCTLVRDGAASTRAFARSASYLAGLGRGISPGPLGFADRGLELSRGFRALKVWMALKVEGVDRWGALFEQNVRQAQHLAARVAREPRLELLAPVPLNIVCFRVRAAPELVDAWNQELLLRIQESGLALPSSTRINGHFAIRVCLTNHRTRQADLDQFLDALLALAADLPAAA